MQENWRTFFYYTLGFAPSLFFGLRFFIQWIGSEKAKKSVVSKNFWIFSLCGNALLLLHYFIQFQLLLFLIQVISGFIAWRNLNLTSKKPLSFKKSLISCLLLISLSIFCFFLQSLSLGKEMGWMEFPLGLGGESSVSLVWHIAGMAGCVLFGARFWLQWFEAERTGRSELSKQFWVLSLVGSALALSLFVRTGDWVSVFNYAAGVVPYVRNMMLLKRKAIKPILKS